MIDNETILTFALAACLVAFGFILRGKQQQCSYPWEYILWDKLKEMEKTMNEALAAVTAKLQAAAAVQVETKEAIVKVGTETESLITKVAELQAVIEGMNGAPAELMAAADAVSANATAVRAALQVVDDKVIDPVTPPVEPPVVPE